MSAASDYWFDRAEAESMPPLSTWSGTHITHDIYVGPCPQYPDQIKAFRAVAICARELQPPATITSFGSLQLIRCPLDDRKDVPVSQEVGQQVLDCAREVARASKLGAVAVACAMGINRSALVATVAIMRVTRLPVRSVIRQMRRVRPQVLNNPRFVDWLETLTFVDST